MSEFFKATGGVSSTSPCRKQGISYVDCTAAPPTEVEGDRYVLDDTGVVHADWDGASALDVVTFKGGVWYAETPQEGWMVYLTTLQYYMYFMAGAWEIWEDGSAAVASHCVTYDHTLLHAAATAGTGISIIGQVITNSDTGSAAVSAHNSAFAHADIATNTGARHTQGTDLGLDTGGTNPITAATLKSHVDDTTGVHVAAGEKSTWNAKVATTLTISTTAPLSGGGDLSSNRTFSMAQATKSVDGYIAKEDFARFEGWVLVSASNYTATPASTTQITMSDTSDMQIGMPLMYEYNGGTYYGFVVSMVANTSITIEGDALDVGHDLTALYVDEDPWSKVSNPIGTISGTANLPLDASLAAEQTVTIDAAAVVTIVLSNFTSEHDSIHVIMTNGGAATSIDYGSIEFDGGIAPMWTVSGVDEFIIYRTGSGAMRLLEISKDIGTP